MPLITISSIVIGLKKIYFPLSLFFFFVLTLLTRRHLILTLLTIPIIIRYLYIQNTLRLASGRGANVPKDKYRQIVQGIKGLLE